MEGRSPEDFPLDLGLSDLPSDLLVDSGLLPDSDFSPVGEPGEAFSDEAPLDPPESLELELLVRESVT